MPDLAKRTGLQGPEPKKVARLLGGERVLGHKLGNPLDVHEILSHGLPGAALMRLMDSLVLMRSGTLATAVGISTRTMQRQRKKRTAGLLSQDQSDRTWRFAEILTKATAIFGSQEEAEQWLERPAIGLNQRRPIDLLVTVAGAKIVDDFLERLEYGVYT